MRRGFRQAQTEMYPLNDHPQPVAKVQFALLDDCPPLLSPHEPQVVRDADRLSDQQQHAGPYEGPREQLP